MNFAESPQNDMTITPSSSPMQMAISTMDDELNRLFDALDGHNASITPILGPDHQSSTPSPEHPMKDNSELVRLLIDQAGRVRSARFALESLTDRVEL